MSREEGLRKAIANSAERRNAQRAALIEEIEWLLDAGLSPGEIMRRLDTNPTALTRRLERADRHDIAAHFSRFRKRPRKTCPECGRGGVTHGATRCRPCAATVREAARWAS